VCNKNHSILGALTEEQRARAAKADALLESMVQRDGGGSKASIQSVEELTQLPGPIVEGPSKMRSKQTIDTFVIETLKKQQNN
jgi:hypothetical protein